MTVVNRSALSVFCSPALEGIKEGVAKGVWPQITAIEDVFLPGVPEKDTYGRAYDILGREVSNDYKGIIIINGKKRIVR